jgi:hypothetical protein
MTTKQEYIGLPDAEYLPRSTVKERVTRGRELRRAVPHLRHGSWAPHRARFDPIAVLERQCAQRVPELVPIRYGRMASSPFAFYRGAAASWPRTWPARPSPASGRSSAATPTC